MKMKMTVTEPSAESVLKKPYTRRLTPDESGGYFASILEFPGCVADGDTADEALENLERVAESWITVALANGQTVRDPVDFEGCSGKLALRMPRMLHKQAAEMAELEGCSLNQLLVTAIAHYVGGKQLVSHIERLQSSWSNNVTFNTLVVTSTRGTSTQRVPNIRGNIDSTGVTGPGSQTLKIPTMRLETVHG